MSPQELYEAWRAARVRICGGYVPAWDCLPRDEREAWEALLPVVVMRFTTQRRTEQLQAASSEETGVC